MSIHKEDASYSLGTPAVQHTTRGQEAIKRSRGRQKRGLLEKLAQAEVNRQMAAEIEKRWGEAE